MEDPKDLKIKEIKIEHDENILSESFSQNLKVSSTSNVTIAACQNKLSSSPPAYSKVQKNSTFSCSAKVISKR